MKTGHEPKVALVTGASSGIGEAFCNLLASKGCELVMVARRENLLAALKAGLEASHPCRVHILAMDLSAPDAPERIFQATEALGLEVDTLINNAGYGLSGAFHERPWAEHRDYLQVMCTAPTQLIHLYLPAMVARGDGRILNVASFSAYFAGSPRLTLYAALKHYLLIMSQSLYAELNGTGVTVTALCPGGTKTDWFEKAESLDAIEGLPKFTFLSPEQVARAGYDAMVQGRIAVIPGFWAKLTVMMSRFIPTGIFLRTLVRSFAKGGK